MSFLEDTGIWWVILFGVVLLLIGIFCIVVALTPAKVGKNLRVPMADGGSMDISLSALQYIVTTTAGAQQGVEHTDARLWVKNSGLYIQIELKVPDNISVTEVGAEVRKAVSAQLEAVTGIIPADIRIVVTAVTSENKEMITYGK